MASNKNNSGVLFHNKKNNEKQPDYRGEVTVNGQQMEISGWIRTSEKGKEYISLQFQEHYKRGSNDLKF